MYSPETNNHDVLDEKQEKKDLEIKYDVEPGKEPKWYIQGSYVLDQIYQENHARDVDVFYPKGENFPLIEDERFIQKIELDPDSYFPPILGTYNLDRYLLTENGILKPQGFQDRPKKLELLPKYTMTIVDIIRGLKISHRYNIEIDDSIKMLWQQELSTMMTEEYQRNMFFDSAKEVYEYILYNLEEETGEDEREVIKKRLEEMMGVSF